MNNATERAVKQLRAYAKYMDENAEDIIGNIDKPMYVMQSGLRFSFTLEDYETAPTLILEKEYLVLDAMGGEGE